MALRTQRTARRFSFDLYAYLYAQAQKKACDFSQAFVFYGAGTKSRTRDVLITSQLLYQLSYCVAGCIIYRQISV